MSYVEDLEEAFPDVLDGNSEWSDIRTLTGHSEQRCKEIEAVFSTAVKNFNKRHGIGEPHKVSHVIEWNPVQPSDPNGFIFTYASST
jgi:hypothetical protein